LYSKELVIADTMRALNRVNISWQKHRDSIKQQLGLSTTEIIVLLVIVAIACSVRFWDLSQIGFNNDEAVYSGQAATLAGHEEFSKHFSIYRAHPLVLQFFVSIVFGIAGISDVVARLVPASFGVMTVVITYFIGKMLYGWKAGIVAASVLALLPYHVIMTRQVMVDIPFSFFFTLTLYFMIKYVRTNNLIWVYAIGASAGLSFLSKEVGVMALIVSVIYLLFTKRLGTKNVAILLASFVLAVSPQLLLILTREEAQQALSLYTVWQLGRTPNHPITFYPDILGQNVLGYVLSALILLSVVYALKNRLLRGFPASLLITWVSVPFVFFMLYPVKGFYFLVQLVPACVLLGTSFLFSSWMKKVPYCTIIAYVFIPLIVLSTSYTPDYFFPQGEVTKILAGSGGMPHMREAALWIKENVPKDSVFVTIHNSMGNMIKFYSNHDAMAISVNPEPGRHNPSYTPITNIDLMVLTDKIQYFVYDVYSAEMSLNLQRKSDELVNYANKYNAVPIHTEYESFRTDDGRMITKPVVIIYAIDDHHQSRMD
jgi:4-amino-4-deoxy-L-arabinose transferase-like glycosyltransferase